MNRTQRQADLEVAADSDRARGRNWRGRLALRDAGSSRRWLWRVLGCVGAVAAVLAVVTARVIVWPASGMPSRVDAIVMMAGPGDRLSVATGLADERRAPVLVVSQGEHGYGGPCPPSVPGVTVICFDPSPGDTRGEAEFAGQLARLHGWHSIVLVTSSEQATRARFMMERCFSGSVYVMTAPVALSQLPYQVAYGWAALAKALVVNRSC